MYVVAASSLSSPGRLLATTHPALFPFALPDPFSPFQFSVHDSVRQAGRQAHRLAEGGGRASGARDELLSDVAASILRAVSSCRADGCLIIGLSHRAGYAVL